MTAFFPEPADCWKYVSLPLALYILFAFLLGYTGYDDSHITYFVADALADGRGLVNYNGAAVEQSSSLLFAIFLSLLVYLSPGDILAADLGPWVSGAFALLFILLVGRWAAGQKMHWLAVGAICLQIPFIHWSLSGMENSMYMVLLFLFAAACAGDEVRGWKIFLLSALLTICRPEAFLVISSAVLLAELLGLHLYRRFSFARILWVMGGVFAVVLIKSGAGYDFFPLPVHAKQAMDLVARFNGGLAYYRATWVFHPVLMSFSIATLAYVSFRALAARIMLSPMAVMALCLALAVAGFSFFSGGDWMVHGRFLLPGFLFAVLLAFSVIASPRRQALLAILLLVNSLPGAYLVSRYTGLGYPMFLADPIPTVNYRPAVTERYNLTHLRDIVLTDRLITILRQDPREQLVISSVQAGYIPYYLLRNTEKKIEFVDLMGLTTTHRQKCPGSFREHLQYYENLGRDQGCVIPMADYIYDLDKPGFERLNHLKSQGCEEVFRESLEFVHPLWGTEKISSQFVVRCSRPLWHQRRRQ